MSGDHTQGNKPIAGGANFVIVQLDEEETHNKKTGFKGVNGMDIELDTSWDPQRHVKLKGTVIQLPRRLVHSPMMQETDGRPSYHSEHKYNYKYFDDIVQEVQLGDIVYFHFNSVTEKNYMGDRMYRIHYASILVVVRKGKIIPIGSYTLVIPDMETWPTILKPTYYPFLDRNQKPKKRPKSEWLQVKLFPTAKALRGFVAHVGKPLKGDKCEIKNGDMIIYRNNADWTVTIEGKDYYVMRQRHILAVLKKPLFEWLKSTILGYYESSIKVLKGWYTTLKKSASRVP